MVITGCMLNGCDMETIEKDTEKIRRNVLKIARGEFYQILGEEIAFLCDSVALGILQREEDRSICDAALANVTSRIQRATAQGLPVRENFGFYIQILYLKGQAFAKLASDPNPKFCAAFKGFEDMSLNEVEAEDSGNGKTVVWNGLNQKYKDHGPASMNLTPEISANRDADPNFFIVPDCEKIRFPSLEARCRMWARHQSTNRYLSMVSGGEQIPPFLLMRYMDEALSYVSDSRNAGVIREEEGRLRRILIDLDKNKDVITRTLRDERVKDLPIADDEKNCP